MDKLNPPPEMKLYWLEPTEDAPYATYDAISFFVVRAPDEATARSLAASQAKDETPDCWLNPQFCTCVEYTFPTNEGSPEIVWSEFHAG